MPGGAAPISGEGFASGGSSAIGFLLTCFAGFGGILFGYDTGTISGIQTMEAWVETFGVVEDGKKTLTMSNQSLVVSILSAGTFFGAIAAGYIADVLGRRWGMIVSTLVFSLGVGLQLATSWPIFILGRVVAGLGVGLISSLAPLYSGETSAKKLRGLVVGLYQWAITIGILIAAIVNNSMATRKGDSGWRIVIALQFAWAVIMIAGMLYLPETPRYLTVKGKTDEAKLSLQRLTGLSGPELDLEYESLRAGLEAEASLGASSYKDLFTRGPEKMLLRTLTGTIIQGMQQLTGINFIFYYGTTFFKRSGISDPFIISIVTNVVNVVSTVPGILLIDRVGRRKMLLTGAVVMSVAEFIVAIVGVTKGNVNADGSVDLVAQKVLIAFVCIYIAAFASTWGPIPWCVDAEVFPSRLRGKGMSLSAASNWLWNFGIGYATPYLVNPSTPQTKTANLGVKVFFLWGATCAGCVVFTYFLVAETKGLSLEQVDELYRNSSPARSNQYREFLLASRATDDASPVVPYSANADEYEEDKGVEVKHHDKHGSTV